MKNVFFGLGLKYADAGTHPHVALGDDGRVLAVCQDQGITLSYRTGRLDQMAIVWGDGADYGRGQRPAIAMQGDYLVEVHRGEDRDGLYSRIGVWNRDGVAFGQARRYASGTKPSVAMNREWVIEVHESSWNRTIWCNIGRFVLDRDEIDWNGNLYLGDGNRPSVAINQAGQIVTAHESDDGDLYLRVGRIEALDAEHGQDPQIVWDAPQRYAAGARPCVALNHDGDVIAVHEAGDGTALMQMFGSIVEGKVVFADEPQPFDDGQRPAVACRGNKAVQVHQSENFYTLWASSSRIVDRSRWMQDHLDRIGARTLPQLTTGASHDAGMYQHGTLMTLGKTQDLNLYQQLSNGIRYFDLRPKWSDGRLYVAHGPITGPSLTQIVDDIARFMAEGHRELVTLKFSHYAGFDNPVYEYLVELLQSRLGAWLYRGLPRGRRLAEIPLRDFVQHSGVVLAVCDEDYPVRIPAAGIWVYRDSESATVEQGDLRVFDRYSNTTSFERMSADQLQKFADYNGMCVGDEALPCDQFLLSWTLTPFTGVWPVSKEANRQLGAWMAATPRENEHDRVINLLYVDYVEYARATDVAMSMNGID
ncbi:hypothetical protein [Lysobacter antibioticus]|uniref:hypothetical protein n=1 Tax=Lysobacter antibioticus TaxID=84531 RepID=UPI00034BD67C|nr:hypothetical protein [Lysobacter antibioticus]